ncbi:hypothetical protein C8R45DRAFT_1217029 [Mycena sanguinolenta]|nr:hypothetical protein C8R45DRAFT_1217029 [Mycena sanguinolenta]
MDPEPVFSPELERTIFEIAAVLDFHFIPTLLRVARRVLQWIEPLFYRDIVIDDSTRAEAFRQALEVKTDLLASSVQHIFVTGYSDWPEEDIRLLLRLCAPQLLSLASSSPTFYEPTLLPIFSHMTQLRRWEGRLDLLFGGYPTVDLSLPAFHTVTHMNVYDDFTIENHTVICVGLSALPCLTHLCLKKSTLAHIPRILTQCAHLQVLAVIAYPATVIADNPPTTDVRFVVSRIGRYLRDWGVGVRGGADFWAAADEFVARKRRGEIKASFYLLDHL